MLDSLIHSHLDKQEKIEINIEDDIDGLMRIVNIGKLIDNPEEVLLAIINEIKENIKENYAQEAIENGIQFAKDIKKKKEDIKIQITNNPELNKDDSISKHSGQD